MAMALVLHVELLVSLTIPVAEQPSHQEFFIPVPGRREDWRFAGKRPMEDCPPNAMHSSVTLSKARFPGLPKPLDFRVPVMLHYQPTFLRVTAYRGTELIWREVVRYMLSPTDFPVAKTSSAWKERREERNAAAMPRELTEIPGTLVEAAVTPEQIAREPFTVDASKKRSVAFEITNPHLAIIMEVVKVVRDDTGEPLTFYINRVWALTGLIIFLSDERVDALYPPPSI